MADSENELCNHTTPYWRYTFKTTLLQWGQISCEEFLIRFHRSRWREMDFLITWKSNIVSCRWLQMYFNAILLQCTSNVPYCPWRPSFINLVSDQIFSKLFSITSWLETFVRNKGDIFWFLKTNSQIVYTQFADAKNAWPVFLWKFSINVFQYIGMDGCAYWSSSSFSGVKASLSVLQLR